RGEERRPGDPPEDRPAEAADPAGPRRGAAGVGLCPGGFVALERLLDPPLLGGGRLLLGGCRLSHEKRFLSDLRRAWRNPGSGRRQRRSNVARTPQTPITSATASSTSPIGVNRSSAGRASIPSRSAIPMGFLAAAFAFS